MIKQLTLQDDTRLVYRKDYILALRYIQQTVNQLVDAVNGILDYAPLEMAMKAEPKTPADPYAEQRKWVGCVCKFWDWDHRNLDHYAKLIDIREIKNGEMSNCPFKADDGTWYMYCEPVKPDDDIIYKGE